MIRTAQPFYSRWKEGRYFKFILVGVANAAVDLIVLNMCLWISPTTSSLMLLFYNTLAVISAIGVSYELNRRYTFIDRSKNPRKEKQLFFAQGLLNVLINNIILIFSFRLFVSLNMPIVLSSNISKVAAMIISSSVSYAILKKYVFHS